MLKRENKYPGKVVEVVNKITLLSTKHSLHILRLSLSLSPKSLQVSTHPGSRLPHNCYNYLPSSYGKEVKGGKGNLSSPTRHTT